MEASRDDLRFTAPLTTISAAVVGTIASLAVFFSGPVLFPAGSFNALAGCIVVAALFAQLKLQWSVLQLMAVAVAVGICIGALLP